ncbi:hypothetical protein F5141DRAFT_1254732 [Pisolithus sp. B1]|nr:hypothetical protein F5141DRAFT_1254732 [Pisolithus sp. B1]
MEEQHKLSLPDDSTNGDRRQVGGVWRRLAASIFLVFLGALSLEELQHIAEKADKKEWNELKKNLTDRTNNINVVAALVVASSAVFLSTPAPTERLSWWNIKLPYFCMQLGFGCAMLAVVSGFSEVVFLSMMGPTDIRRARDRLLTCIFLLMLMMFPLAFLIVAALSVGLGFIGALWVGQELWIKSELDVRASGTKVDRAEKLKKYSQGKAASRRSKGKPTDQPHLSKKAKKTFKERKEIEKEVREAEAEVDKEERAGTHTETLKLLFVLYFRVLKNPHPTPLLPAALRGII